MPPGAPGMGNVFVNQGGVLKRVCIKENFNPACCDSRLTCDQRPVENCCTAHNTAVSGCAWSHPGESSGSCVPWNPAHCGAETKNHCVLQAANHNVIASNPRCKSGWTGSCSYRCNDGNFDKITNSCKKNCSSKEFPIAGTRCVLPASNHHATTRRTGRCTSGYGACSGICNNGHWVSRSNICRVGRSCSNISASSHPGCPITGTRSHGWNISGLRCSSGYTGTCAGRCNDRTLTVTNGCTQARGCFSILTGRLHRHKSATSTDHSHYECAASGNYECISTACCVNGTWHVYHDRSAICGNNNWRTFSRDNTGTYIQGSGACKAKTTASNCRLPDRPNNKTHHCSSPYLNFRCNNAKWERIVEDDLF